LMRVTEICADAASQQDEKQMGGLKMSWNTERGRLVCRWVDSQKDERPNLSLPKVPASRTLSGSRARAASVNGSVPGARNSRGSYISSLKPAC
jgi:hypothetical protein